MSKEYMVLIFVVLYLLPTILFTVGDKRLRIAMPKFFLGLFIGPVYFLMFFIILYVYIQCILKHPLNDDDAWEECINYLNNTFSERLVNFLLYIKK